MHRELVSAAPSAPPERALRAVGGTALTRPGLDTPIESKLHPPAARKEWLQRPGLLHELAHTVSAKLVLVDAPAGFGKTTLVAQWRSSAIERRRFAWLSLDAGDDDPGRLWWHVVSALERACPELDGQDLRRALRTQVPDIADAVIPSWSPGWSGCRNRSSWSSTTSMSSGNADCHQQVASLLLHLPPAVRWCSSPGLTRACRSRGCGPSARWSRSGCASCASRRCRRLRWSAACPGSS